MLAREYGISLASVLEVVNEQKSSQT